MDELRPDPLDGPRKDDIVFVGTGCLGLFLAAVGGYMLLIVANGATLRGNIGRTMTFADRLVMSGAIMLAGLLMLAITWQGWKRLKDKR